MQKTRPGATSEVANRYVHLSVASYMGYRYLKKTTFGSFIADTGAKRRSINNESASSIIKTVLVSYEGSLSWPYADTSTTRPMLSLDNGHDKIANSISVLFSDCGDVPQIEHGNITILNDSKFGSQANVTCDTEYTPDNTYITCLATGYWDNVTCIRTGFFIYTKWFFGCFYVAATLYMLYGDCTALLVEEDLRPPLAWASTWVEPPTSDLINNHII